MRKLRAYAQMDKQKAMKDLEERLKKEHSLEIASLRSILINGECPSPQQGSAPKQVSFSYVICILIAFVYDVGEFKGRFLPSRARGCVKV